MRRQRGEQVEGDGVQADKTYKEQQDANAFLSEHVVRIRTACHSILIKDVAVRLQRYQDLVKELKEKRPKLEEFETIDDLAATFYMEEEDDENINNSNKASSPKSTKQNNNNNNVASSSSFEGRSPDNNNTSDGISKNEEVVVTKKNENEDDDALVAGKSILDTNTVKQVIALSPAGANINNQDAAETTSSSSSTIIPPPHTAFLQQLRSYRSTTNAAAAAATKSTSGRTPTTPSDSSSAVVQALQSGNVAKKSSSENAAAKIAKTIAGGGGESGKNGNSTSSGKNGGSGVTVYTTTRINPHSHSPHRDEDDHNINAKSVDVDAAADGKNNNNDNKNENNTQQQQQQKPNITIITNHAANLISRSLPNNAGGGAITKTTNLVTGAVTHSSPYTRTLPSVSTAKSLLLKKKKEKNEKQQEKNSTSTSNVTSPATADPSSSNNNNNNGKKKNKPPLPLLSKSVSPLTDENSSGAVDALDAAVADIPPSKLQELLEAHNAKKNKISKKDMLLAKHIPEFLRSLPKHERKQFQEREDESILKIRTKRAIWTLPETLKSLLPQILGYASLLRREALTMIAVFQELGAYILLSTGPVGRDASRLYNEDIEFEGYDPRDREVGDLVISNSVLMVGALQALAGHRTSVIANLLKMEAQNPITIHMLSTCNQGIAQMLLASWDYLHRGFTTLRRLTCLMHNLVGKNWESLENLHKMNQVSQRVGDNLKVVATLKRRFKKGSK